jgi:addiction module RelE/StbE family toxin
MYELAQTSYFERRLERFNRTHPALRDELTSLFLNLQEDPFQPRLRFHRLTGRLVGLSAVRLTYDIRLVFEIDTDAGLITLINIGTHQEVYR